MDGGREVDGGGGKAARRHLRYVGGEVEAGRGQLVGQHTGSEGPGRPERPWERSWGRSGETPRPRSTEGRRAEAYPGAPGWGD